MGMCGSRRVSLSSFLKGWNIAPSPKKRPRCCYLSQKLRSTPATWRMKKRRLRHGFKAERPITVTQTQAFDIVQAVEARKEELIALRRDFHQHPELSFKEERTARAIAERLHDLHLDE